MKVFEIMLCMYLKTISPDVPRFTFVCSIIKFDWSLFSNRIRGRCGRGYMVAGFTFTYAVSVYHHLCHDSDYITCPNYHLA
jgi:hypothetical protein